jgi:hypothetical protein
MQELVIDNKQVYFDKNYPFTDPPKLTDKKRCIHCDNVITVGDYKVYKDKSGMEYISCPNSPDCNGSVIDWIDLD